MQHHVKITIILKKNYKLKHLTPSRATLRVTRQVEKKDLYTKKWSFLPEKKTQSKPIIKGEKKRKQYEMIEALN